MKRSLILLAGVLILASCTQTKKKEAVEPLDTSSMGHKVSVTKAIQANSYTYLLVEEGGQAYWIAVDKMEPAIGGTYYYTQAMEMNDFHSKDLDTTFAQVFFVQDLGTEQAAEQPAMNAQPTAPGRRAVEFDDAIRVEPATGGITVAQLFGDKAGYSGKEVLLRGQVTKVNNDIMDRNWVHIQDGTETDGQFDLTFTTDSYVKVGDVVTVQGKVALDKDFGAGYFYDVIVEGAKVQ